MSRPNVQSSLACSISRSRCFRNATSSCVIDAQCTCTTPLPLPAPLEAEEVSADEHDEDEDEDEDGGGHEVNASERCAS